MKIHLFCDEKWPYYNFFLDGGYGTPVNVSEEIHDRWEQVMADFVDVQEEMAEIYSVEVGDVEAHPA